MMKPKKQLLMLEGRRKYFMAGGRKIYLSHLVSAVCGGLLALTFAFAYVGVRYSRDPGTDLMVRGYLKL